MRLSLPVACPKPRHPKVDRAERRAKRLSTDRRETAKVKARSGGRCEVYETDCVSVSWPCFRRAVHVHHMLKPRGVGKSALAIHKQHVCLSCHRDIEGGIGGKRLIRQGGVVPLWTDTYKRVK